MGIFQSIGGTVEVELTSAAIEASLEKLIGQGIPIADIRADDPLTAQFRIHRRDFRRVRKFTEKQGGQLRLLHRRGIYWDLKRITRRPLILGILILLLLSLMLQRRVLFVQVEGNTTIPTRQILDAAAESGIRFGSRSREVRSEKMKNALLASIPELQWAGVNTYGSVAVITVRERTDREEENADTGISSIVASRDGVILSCTATSGNLLCQPGQAVSQGDTLISCYTDCGLCVTADRAEGEILALTSRSLSVLTPAEAVQRAGKQQSRAKFALIIGKKRINFYKGSGIYDASCVKMYSKYVLTLPGGFALPVALVKETVIPCQTSPLEVGDAEEMLRDFASRYLSQQMVAGTVVDRHETVRPENGAWHLQGSYACTEMIGKRQQEQIGVVP